MTLDDRGRIVTMHSDTAEPNAATDPRTSPGRRTRWAAATAAVLAAAAGTVFLLTRGDTPAALRWTDLPDPGRGAVGTGQTLGQGGGDSSGPVSLSGLDITRVVIDVRCEGVGSIAVSGAGRSLGGGECFDGQPVGFALTSGPLAPIMSLEVTSDPGVIWRVYVSAG